MSCATSSTKSLEVNLYNFHDIGNDCNIHSLNLFIAFTQRAFGSSDKRGLFSGEGEREISGVCLHYALLYVSAKIPFGLASFILAAHACRLRL